MIFLSCKSRNRYQPGNDSLEAKGNDTTITFENAAIDKMPPGWSSETGAWRGTVVDGNSVLMMKKHDGSDFNIAVLKQGNYRNLEIDIRIKAVKGEGDQGGGLVWRYIDRDNYTSQGRIRL